jgi:hypothetical protein
MKIELTPTHVPLRIIEIPDGVAWLGLIEDGGVDGVVWLRLSADGILEAYST